MNEIVRYIVATVLAVGGGYIGYHFVPIEPFGVTGNVLFMAALFGLFAGLFEFTGFFGNVINAFLFTFLVYFLAPGGFVLEWFWGNLGYAVGNVFGQLTRLSFVGKVGARAL
jgi:mannose/fructose/N-acetylgalactosamine-specific phosphotransferase system component IID